MCSGSWVTSYSPYKFLEQIDPKSRNAEAGYGSWKQQQWTARKALIPGLSVRGYATGKQAVQPLQRDISFRSGKVEAVDTSGHCVRQMYLDQIEGFLPEYLANILLDHDFDAERSFRERGNKQIRSFYCVQWYSKEPDSDEADTGYYAAAPERI